jgi:serine/threonine protein kinase
MWSIGVIMYFVLSGEFPFMDENEVSDLLIHVVKVFPSAPMPPVRPGPAGKKDRAGRVRL